MPLPVHVVDAFASEPFAGNPAAVVLLAAGEPSDALMRSIAAEMKHSETAFVCPRADGGFDLRWFTPEVEVDLCGHATLATAHVLWELERAPREPAIRFHTRSGWLSASKTPSGAIELDLPRSPVEALAHAPAGLLDALGVGSRSVHRTRFDYLVELSDEAEVRGCAPDLRALRALGVRGVMITAPAASAELDFVSRFFAPGAGIDEDPVTGSAHCALAPFWAGRLAKSSLRARQVSARGGDLVLAVRGDRIGVAGFARTVLVGTLEV